MRSVASFCVLLVLAGCIGETNDGARVDVNPTGSEWSRGTHKEIILTFRNTGERFFEYTSSSCWEPVAWVPLASGRISLLPPGEAENCAHAIVEASVEPGGELRSTFSWNGSINPGNANASHVPAGTYTIYGGFVGETTWNATGSAVVYLR